MISKEELNRIAQQTGLTLYQQEKDYLLKLFLYFYYKHYNGAIFKGGTCLKYLLGLPRFSEDLDFNIKHPSIFLEQVKSTLEKIKLLGINYYFLKEESFKDSYTCEIGFEGPLFTGTRQTQNKFRIDAGYRTGTFKKPEWKLIKSEYPETSENFLVQIMAMEEIMAEKIIAMFQRKKGRDIFDLWFLMNAKVELNKELLAKKLKKENQKIDVHNIVNKREYERDMFRLTSKVIPYEQIQKEVGSLIKSVK